MELLLEDKSVKLSETEISYVQNISSNIYINGEETKESTNKKIVVKTQDKTSSSEDLIIKSKLVNISLDSKFKKQEQLSEQINEVINNVHLQIKNNEFVAVKNHQEIILKWKTLKKELIKKYKGDSVAHYFNGLSRRIENQDSLLKNFNQLKGFGLLLKAPFSNYKVNKSLKQKRNIDHMVGKLPLSFDEEILYKGFENSELTFSIKGALAHEQAYPNKIKNYFTRLNLSKDNNLKLNTYSGRSQYNNKTGFPNNKELTIAMSYGNYYKKELNYNLLKQV